MIVTNRSMTATVQIGTATFVRNNNGIPTMVIPIMPNNAMMPKQMLWQTCHEPNMLAAPETLPVAPIAFSFMFLIIPYQCLINPRYPTNISKIKNTVITNLINLFRLFS